MQLEFWFDPACPFTWITSRWVLSIAADRDLEIHWRAFSLLLQDEAGFDPERRPTFAHSRDLLRVVEAVWADGQADRIGELYTEMGRRIHHDKDPMPSIAEVLAAVGLDASLAAAAADPAWDVEIEGSMKEALGLGGEDVGVPIVAGTMPDGTEVGFFGPILSAVPPHDEALAVFDASCALAAVSDFSELKRRRPHPKLPARP